MFKSLCLFFVFAASLLSLNPHHLYARQKTDNNLTLYTSVDNEWAAAVAQKFEKDTGIKVNWMRESSGVVLQRLKNEKNVPAGDVWFGGTLDAHGEASQLGLLQEYRSAKTGDLRDSLQNPLGNGLSTGAYTSILGFAVNEQLLTKLGKPVPQTWDDLTNPIYKDLIGMASPITSGTAFTALATLVRLKGSQEQALDYLKKLNKNITQYSQSGTAPVLMTSKGEIAIAIVFLHECTRYRLQGYPLKEVIPADGTGYEIGGLSLIKGAPNTELGKKFIDWALTPQAQELAANTGSYQVPSNTLTKINPNVTPLESAKLVNLDINWIMQNREHLLKDWNDKIFAQPK